MVLANMNQLVMLHFSMNNGNIQYTLHTIHGVFCSVYEALWQVSAYVIASGDNVKLKQHPTFNFSHGK